MMTLPNQLTILRIILTPVFFYLFIQQSTICKIVASLIFLLASLTDWYDGYIARRFDMTTSFGQFMDPLADKLLVSTALMLFAYLGYVYWWMVILVVIRDFTVTFLRIFAVSVGQHIVTSSFAKWKTGIQMTFIFVLLLYLNLPFLPDIHLNIVSDPWIQWTTLTMLVVVFLTVISGIQYLLRNRSLFKEISRRVLGQSAK